MSREEPAPEPVASGFDRIVELNSELKSLDFEKDPEARDRQAELLDELMTLDMALQPIRRQMGQARQDSSAGGAKRDDSNTST